MIRHVITSYSIHYTKLYEVTDLAPYQTTQSAVPGLEAIPVEDSTKQRASIKAHFEEENLEEINGIMAELSQVLTSDKHITLKTATGYVV